MKVHTVWYDSGAPETQSTTDETKQNDRFLLSQGSDSTLLLLGCPLELTPRERTILDALLKHYPTPLSPEAICAICPELTPGSIPVHINSINKKASLISGRRLINAQRKVGYIVNQYM